MTSFGLAPQEIGYYPTSNFPWPPPADTIPPGMSYGMNGLFIADKAGLPYNGHMILGSVGFMTGLTLLVVCTRLYVRQFMLKTFSADDWVISLGLIHSLGVTACFIGMVANGGGRHWYHIQVPEEYQRYKHFQFTQVCIQLVGLSVVKVSIGLGMLRFIFGKKTRWVCIGLMSFVSIVTVITLIPFLVECTPMSISWAYKRDPFKCMRPSQFKSFADVNGASNIATDLAFVLLPIPTIWKLKINLRTKLSIVAVLSVGTLAGVCAIVRWYAGLAPFIQQDAPWTCTYALWGLAELDVGLIAASLPALRHLCAYWLGEQSRRFRTGQKSNTAGPSNSSSGWKRHHNPPQSMTEDWQKTPFGGGSEEDGLGISSHAARGSPGENSSQEVSKSQGIMRSTEIRMEKLG